MLYHLLKPIVRLAALIFCRKIKVNKPELLDIKGPVLLACNHPNSFLDSVILDILFKQPIWSLARGDAFTNNTVKKILGRLKMLPVYRSSEGKENLVANYATFDACIEIFRNNGIVQIFSEGKCVNEWHLRPLKKGTARLALQAWEQNIPLKILPVGINYSSFRFFGKNVFLNFGDFIERQNIDMNAADGMRFQLFNQTLRKQLEHLVWEIPPNNKSMQEKKLAIPIPYWKKMMLSIPALLGWIIHQPIYIPVKSIVLKRTRDNDHYDSILIGVLVFLYPLIVIAVTTLAILLTRNWWMISLAILIPFTAWAYVQLKKQLSE